MNKRRAIIKGVLGFAIAGLLIFVGLSVVKSASAAPDDILFTFRTSVINFNLQTGVGNETGHVDGVLQGDYISNFQFIFTSQTTVATPNDRALFTDVDGNQILFKYAGTGTFFNGLSDNTPSLPNPPGAVNLGNVQAVGGYFLIDYTVLQASPKYAFLVGRIFPAKIAASNSAYPSNGVFGSSYGEIYAPDVPQIRHKIKHG
jgi:hypothetical protein